MVLRKTFYLYISFFNVCHKAGARQYTSFTVCTCRSILLDRGSNPEWTAKLVAGLRRRTTE